jgi:soluble lytic murein transglycosylase-like protein
MRRAMQIAMTAAVATLGSPRAALACWAEAERLYGVSAQLLYAVARAESDLNPKAVNLTPRGRTGTYDIGLMQINSSHLRKLRSFGIEERDLLDPCTNIKVGAWLMADAFARHGVSWEGVGSYNAACTQLKGDACRAARSKYAWRVFRRLPPSAPAQPAATRRSTSEPPLILSTRVSP